MTADTEQLAAPWLDFIAQRVGTTKWAVAARLSPRLRDKGYLVAVTPKRYAALRNEWAQLTDDISTLTADELRLRLYARHGKMQP